MKKIVLVAAILFVVTIIVLSALGENQATRLSKGASSPHPLPYGDLLKEDVSWTGMSFTMTNPGDPPGSSFWTLEWNKDQGMISDEVFVPWGTKTEQVKAWIAFHFSGSGFKAESMSGPQPRAFLYYELTR